MNQLILGAFLITAGTAFADKPCYQEMSDAVYAQYAKDEGYTLEQAQERADLFIDSFETVNRRYVFNVELAEQYATGSESGYFPGTPYKVTMTKSCSAVSVEKVEQ